MQRSHMLIIGVVVVLLSGVWYFFWGSTTEITNYPPKNEIIVAFGDSLVEGYGASPGKDFVSVLADRLDRPIINLGVDGDTTKDGLDRVDEVIDKDPGVVILLLGGNDYLRRVDEEVTKANLAELIRTFQENGSVIVLLGVRGGVLRDGRSEMFEDLSKEYGTVYVEDVLRGLIGRSEFMHDTIHPNDHGYAVIADRLYDVFTENNL